MWLRQFYQFYPEIILRYTGKRQDVAAVEQGLSKARGRMRIGPDELRIIEESEAWTYWRWWPRLSRYVEQPVQLPPGVLSRQGKRKAIAILYGAFKHIEVVSVVLRFLCPEEFGILSPPVASLINLSWAEVDDQINYYDRYLAVLADLRSRGGLEKVAHADMALWAAAHHFVLPNSAPLVQQMNADEYFRDVRLSNFLEGFGKHWGQTEHERLALARVLLRHDGVLAGLVAGKCYESVVKRIARRYELTREDNYRDTLDHIIAKLEERPRALRILGVSISDLHRWRECRNDAVHNTLTKGRAKDLIQGIERLERSLERQVGIAGSRGVGSRP